MSTQRNTPKDYTQTKSFYSTPSSLTYPSPTPSPKHSSETETTSYPNIESSDDEKIKLDISGDFPYFEPDSEDKADEEKRIANLDPNKELTQHQTQLLEEYTLKQHGYTHTAFIAKTLQGKVFNAIRNDDSKRVVIKKTSKKLHKMGITITKKGKHVAIKEDIVREAQILKEFHANKPPSSLIGYYDFLQDSHYFYLVMEEGGSDYFDFVVKCHALIINEKLSLIEWRKQCKFMFSQMVQFVYWMHAQMDTAHLDISLENVLIRPTFKYHADSKTLSGCFVKFIDFGLVEHFDSASNVEWKCKKYVGKTHYKAPKIYAKEEEFCANKADVGRSEFACL